MELVAARTKYTKTFDLGERKHSIECSLGPIHYQDGAEWHDVDITIRETATHFIIEGAPYRCRVSKTEVSCTFESRKKGRVEFGLEAIGDTITSLNINPKVVLIPEGGRVAEHYEIHYTDIVSGLDFWLVPTVFGVEWFKVIKNATAPRRFRWRVTQDRDRDFRVQEITRGRDSMPRRFDTGSYRDKRPRMAEMRHRNSAKVRQGNRETFTIDEEWLGRVSEVVNGATRQKEWAPDVVYPLVVDVLIEADIANANDDIHDEDGTLDTDNTIIYCGIYYGTRISGFRFQNVTLPVDATVDNATFTFFVEDESGAALTADIFGIQKSIPVWSDSGGEGPADQGPRTTASVAVDDTTGSIGNDVDAIVEEILSDTTGPAWSTGDDMGFVIVPDSGDGPFIRISEFGTANPATLVINYTAAAGGANPKGPLGMPLHGPFAGPVA